MVYYPNVRSFVSHLLPVIELPVSSQITQTTTSAVESGREERFYIHMLRNRPEDFMFFAHYKLFLLATFACRDACVRAMNAILFEEAFNK